MRKTSIFLIAFLAVFLIACGGTNPAAEEPPTGTETKTETTGKTDAPETAAEGVTGVRACDEYLTKVEKLMNNEKVPQASRDAYKQTLEQNRAAWKQAASTPQGKAQLESSCQAALTAMKSAFDQYGN